MDPSIFINKVDPWNEWNLSYDLVFFLTWIETKIWTLATSWPTPLCVLQSKRSMRLDQALLTCRFYLPSTIPWGDMSFPEKIINFLLWQGMNSCLSLGCWNLVHREDHLILQPFDNPGCQLPLPTTSGMKLHATCPISDLQVVSFFLFMGMDYNLYHIFGDGHPQIPAV
jgi:hypothetical protein